ncbi:MAG: YrdB family protein [Saprospiraceae bacterium]|nr:YrdB family protein [Saprospiraceae bacterium]
MHHHPINLAVRFLLELAALACMGTWAWKQHDGSMKWALTILLPLVAALVWGIFRVDGDPGKAPVEVAGWLRLLIEAVFFGAAIWMLRDMKQTNLFHTMLTVTVLHYLVSYDRILKFLGF